MLFSILIKTLCKRITEIFSILQLKYLPIFICKNITTTSSIHQSFCHIYYYIDLHNTFLTFETHKLLSSSLKCINWYTTLCVGTAIASDGKKTEEKSLHNEKKNQFSKNNKPQLKKNFAIKGKEEEEKKVERKVFNVNVNVII